MSFERFEGSPTPPPEKEGGKEKAEEIDEVYKQAAQEKALVSSLGDNINSENPHLQFGKYSQEYPKELAQKVKQIDRNLTLPEYLFRVFQTVEKEFDPEKVKVHKPQSFSESRFISTKDIYERRQGSCGSLSNLVASILRHEGIPTKLVHGYRGGKEAEDRHAWIEVYFPSIQKWIPLDVMNKGDYRISSEHVKLKEYRDWEELEKDYQEGNF